MASASRAASQQTMGSLIRYQYHQYHLPGILDQGNILYDWIQRKIYRHCLNRFIYRTESVEFQPFSNAVFHNPNNPNRNAFCGSAAAIDT